MIWNLYVTVWHRIEHYRNQRFLLLLSYMHVLCTFDVQIIDPFWVYTVYATLVSLHSKRIKPAHAEKSLYIATKKCFEV